jgi:hypothetical protein
MKEIQANYPKKAEEWEEKYGNAWEQANPDGKPWEAESIESTPERARDTSGKTAPQPKKQNSFTKGRDEEELRSMGADLPSEHKHPVESPSPTGRPHVKRVSQEPASSTVSAVTAQLPRSAPGLPIHRTGGSSRQHLPGFRTREPTGRERPSASRIPTRTREERHFPRASVPSSMEGVQYSRGVPETSITPANRSTVPGRLGELDQQMREHSLEESPTHRGPMISSYAPSVEPHQPHDYLDTPWKPSFHPDEPVASAAPSSVERIAPLAPFESNSHLGVRVPTILPSTSSDEDDEPREDRAMLVFKESVGEEMFNQPAADVAPAQVGAYNKCADILVGAHEQGSKELVQTAMGMTGMPCDSWVVKRKSSKICEYRSLSYELWLMVLGWDPLVLHHFVRGDIPKAYEENRDLRKILQSQRTTATKVARPCIYAQYLADGEGNSPTVATLNKILDSVDIYIRSFELDGDLESAEFAHGVDLAASKTVTGFVKYTLQKANDGERRYIQGDEQLKKCKEWVFNSREQLKGVDPTSRPRPWSEVGYTSFPFDRLAQHLAHSSSNYLMNLTESICKEKFQRYKIRQFVVFRVVHPAHAMFAEILASRIGLAYTTQGGGFCHHSAGQSHGGIHDITPEMFEGLQKRLWKDPAFNDRVNADLQMIRDRTQLNLTCVAAIERIDELDKEIRETKAAILMELLLAETSARCFAEEFLKDTEALSVLLDLARSLEVAEEEPEVEL